MQFKTNPVIALPGEVKATLEGIKTNKVTLIDLKGKDLKCAQCMRLLEEEDKIIVIQDTKFTGKGVELDEQLQIVHILNSEGHNCMEDFMARLNTKYATPLPEDKPPPPQTQVEPEK